MIGPTGRSYDILFDNGKSSRRNRHFLRPISSVDNSPVETGTAIPAKKTCDGEGAVAAPVAATSRKKKCDGEGVEAAPVTKRRSERIAKKI